MVNRLIDSPYEYLENEINRLFLENKLNKNINVDEFLEKEVYGSDSITSNFFNDIELQNKLKEKVLTMKIPIKGQDYYSYWLLDRHSNMIKLICKENNLKITNDIVLGTLPIDAFDAYTCEFPNKQKLIALSHGLFFFLHSMGNVLASFFTMQKDSKDEKKEIFDFNPETVLNNITNNKRENNNFVNVLFLFCINKNYISVKKQLTNNGSLAFVFYDIAELFIVAHEYSHILLDHLSENKEFMKKFLSDDSELYQILRNWEEEYSADELALQFVLASSNENKYGFFGSYLAIEFLFGCFSIIEKIYGIEATETHPSAQMRIDNVRRSLYKYLPDEATSIIEGSKIAYDALNKLWDLNKENFYQIFNKYTKKVKA